MREDFNNELLRQYPLGKAELAHLYSPHVCRKSAMRLLNKYIHRAKGLLPALEEVGYSRGAHAFTRRQLELVLRYLGEP